jgi:Protein of unknown function (DUF2933)
MDWLGENAFFVIILLLCVGMHLFHDHGGRGDVHENQTHDHDKYN